MDIQWPLRFSFNAKMGFNVPIVKLKEAINIFLHQDHAVNGRVFV